MSCDAMADARHNEQNADICGEGEGDILLTKHHHKCSHFCWTLYSLTRIITMRSQIKSSRRRHLKQIKRISP